MGRHQIFGSPLTTLSTRCCPPSSMCWAPSHNSVPTMLPTITAVLGPLSQLCPHDAAHHHRCAGPPLTTLSPRCCPPSPLYRAPSHNSVPAMLPTITTVATTCTISKTTITFSRHVGRAAT
ncbi:hypothetical protein BgiMline_034991 [Biomphalaria glabrata]|nr:hypothetical protein BgiMline_029540 [Biomphalaria glabrata]